MQLSEREGLELWRKSVTASVRSDAPDLTARQQAVLMTIALTPGPHTVRGLAEHLGIAKPAVTRALDALERLDFIRRLPDDTDLRSIFVERTPEGMGYLRAFARLVLAAASGEETGSGKPPAPQFRGRLRQVARWEAAPMLDFNDVRLARPEGTPCAFQVSAGATAIRQTPAPDGLVMTFALHGETLDLFREEGEFGLVQCRRDRYIGWTLMEALSAPVLPVTHKVKALRTYAFSRPDIKSSPHFMLSLGARVAATGRQEGLLVECDRAGWVHQRHLVPLDAFEDDPAGVARRFLEAPYLWGGRESLGLDCSGLLQQAFEACGVLLPRDSDMQHAWAGSEMAGTSRICPQNGMLWRGDVVFWTDHVGVLTGPDTLLHANAHHMAVAEEPFAEAIERIEKSAGPVLEIRRLDLAVLRGLGPGWLTP